MATLTESAHVSRIVIKWGIVGICGLMVGRMIIGGLIAWYKATHPVIPDPTIGFGVLPPVAFPEEQRPQLTYRLETITGGLPAMPTQADVILELAERPNLLAMERATREAAAMGFKVQPEKISDLEYQWKLVTPIPSTLTSQIYDGRFTWITHWESDPNFLAAKTLPTQSQAAKEVRDLVRKTGQSIDDLPENNAELNYLKGVGGTFRPVPSLSDADFVQVDLFRQLYKEKHPFVTPVPDQGVVRVILSGNPKDGRVVQATYNYFPLDYTTTETYPLRPIDQAWEELQAGKGYVARLDRSVTDVVVRKVELGYYDSFEPQKYMQPVYVFTGDNNFVAYVQAVREPTNTEE